MGDLEGGYEKRGDREREKVRAEKRGEGVEKTKEKKGVEWHHGAVRDNELA